MILPTTHQAGKPADLGQLAAQINEQHRRCVEAVGSALDRARAAGELLLQAKTRVAHGEWLPWLKANCPELSVRTSQAYTRVAREWDRLQAAKCATVAHLDGQDDLSLREGLRLLAEPSVRVEPDGCRVPMPALRPGMCYQAWSDAPLRPGEPVYVAMEIVPSEQEGYWRYGFLEMTLPPPPGTEDESDGWIVCNVRGIALNRPEVWRSLTRNFGFVGQWHEAPKAGHDFLIPDLGDQQARAIRRAQILGVPHDSGQAIAEGGAR